MGTHTPCLTHIFLARFPQTSRARMAQGVFSVCVSYLPISPSPFSCFIRRLLLFPHGQFDTTFPSELYQAQKRGSSAPPHVRRGVWLLGRSHALNKEKIGTMLNQPCQQRTSRLQRDSRLLLQGVFEGFGKSVHRLHSTFDLSVALALALGRGFRYNFTMPTILDSVTESDNVALLVGFEDNPLVPSEIQMSHQSPSLVRVYHTLDGIG